MIINSISLRNFKSYGNNLQKVFFSKEGSLLLLSGENGRGKSSFLESIDFSLYNIVRGKNKSRVPLYILPNRTNKNLETEIDFQNWNGDNIIINRRLNPKGLKITVNGIDLTEKYELMSQQEKDNIIGIEYNTYKSLVSLNLADFANFINLDTDTKKKLLNKLFNIEEIDNYQSIAKEMFKNEYKRKEKLETLILSNENTMSTYRDNLIVILEHSGIKNQQEIKDTILMYKKEYIPLKNEIKELKELIINKNQQIRNMQEILSSKKNKILEDEFLLGELSKKIDLFKSGSCPYCGSELTNDTHEKKLENLLQEYEKAKSDILYLKRGFNELKIEFLAKNDEKKNHFDEKNQKEIRISFLEDELKELRRQYDNISESVSLNEINKNIDKLEAENIKMNIAHDKLDSRINKLEKLINILSEKGIRKDIIKTVVDPINEHLAKYLVELESKFNVKLNDSFDAVIKERYIDDVHIESLSTGEARKINVAIALSYMEMVMSMNKRTNILFLDEVFASVDPENIDLMLNVLRKFSILNKINIIIVNHSQFDNTKFDRVLKVEKRLGYSFIDELL
jgi:DNA repair exonuclease SbcCD ATPase subunit